MKQNQSNYDSNFSRREFMKILGIAGTSFSVLGVTGCFNKSSNTLRFYGTGTLDIGKNWNQIEKDLGIKIQFEDNGNDTGPIIANMLNGTAAYDFDLGGIQGGVERELALANKIIKNTKLGKHLGLD
jgi:putative spermidine/putrescine transport system substrate-binding protein